MSANLKPSSIQLFSKVSLFCLRYKPKNFVSRRTFPLSAQQSWIGEVIDQRQQHLHQESQHQEAFSETEETKAYNQCKGNWKIWDTRLLSFEWVLLQWGTKDQRPHSTLSCIIWQVAKHVRIIWRVNTTSQYISAYQIISSRFHSLRSESKDQETQIDSEDASQFAKHHEVWNCTLYEV